MNGCPFWYERGLIGAVLTLLLRIGEVFIVGCMTPPSPPLCGACRGDGFSGFRWFGAGLRCVWVGFSLV